MKRKGEKRIIINPWFENKLSFRLFIRCQVNHTLSCRAISEEGKKDNNKRGSG